MDMQVMPVSGNERMVQAKLVQPMFRSMLRVWASAITLAAALTSWVSLMPAGFWTGRMSRSRVRRRRGRRE